MDSLENWTDFNVAMTGAAAGLAGLVIVAMSVNIAELVKYTQMTSRLATAIATLVLAIAASAAGLIPELSAVAYGLLVIIAALLAAVFAVHAARAIAGDRNPRAQAKTGKIALNFVAPALYLVGGALLVAGSAAGFVLLAAGAVVAIVAAVLVAWIVLVEVLR